MNVDPRKLCQIEISVGDLSRAQDFYRDAFGWLAVPAELHRYVVLTVPDDCPFGVSLIPNATAAGGRSIMLYFSVDDPKGVTAAVVAAGGKASGNPTALAGYGLVYLVEDPDGNRFGLYVKAGQPHASR